MSTTYSLLAVRDVPDGAVHPDTGLLHPVPGRQPESVRREHLDGPGIVAYGARGISLRYTNGKRDLTASHDVTMRVFVTASRIALACSGYEQYTFTGEQPRRLASSGALQAAGSHPGARPSMLVGQVRYQWLHAVYGERDAADERMRLRLFVETAGRMLRADIWLDGVAESDPVVLDIARRSAEFRLERDARLTDVDRDDLARIAGLRSLVTPRSKKLLPGVGFPNHLPVSKSSARLLAAA